MIARRIKASELPELLQLYAFLHPEDPKLSPTNDSVRRLWQRILAEPNSRYFVGDEETQIVTTCVLTIIPNLTRALRPYALVENVVTDPKYRRKGFATQLLAHALGDAWSAGCYKVMLETGTKDEETLRFYEKAGFQRGVKTGFVAYPLVG